MNKLRACTDHTDVLYNRAMTLAKLGRHEEALHVYDEVLRLDPDHRDAYEKKGEALLALYPRIPPRNEEQEHT